MAAAAAAAAIVESGAGSAGGASASSTATIKNAYYFKNCTIYDVSNAGELLEKCTKSKLNYNIINNNKIKVKIYPGKCFFFFFFVSSFLFSILRRFAHLHIISIFFAIKLLIFFYSLLFNFIFSYLFIICIET